MVDAEILRRRIDALLGYLARLEAPETYRDAFAILAKHGVVDAELGQRLQGWAG